MEDLMIKIDNIKKQYRLGAIGGGTLQGDLQTWWAKVRGKEDPNSIIGAKIYKKNEKFMALDGVSFEVKKGERVGIIGHNGAGKSTLLKLLSRVTAPTEGRIFLNGRVASMLEVGTGFHGELTGRENIYMNGAILGMTKAEIDAKMEDIIEFSECRQFIDTPVKRYSSGMYVKLAFSVAAHLDSEIMIMDEVLAVGDMAFQRKCLDKMSQVSETEGRTILYVSHNMNTIRQLCDRVIVLDHGAVLFDGDVDTGISQYLGLKTICEKRIDYTKYEREKWITSNNVRVLSVEQITDASRVPFSLERNEKLLLNLQLKVKKVQNDVGIRFEIRDEVNMPLAASNTFFNSFPQQVTLAYNLSRLAPGKYMGVIVLFSLGVNGESLIEDWVNSISFEIVDTIGADKLRWNRRDLGCFILQDGSIINETSSAIHNNQQ